MKRAHDRVSLDDQAKAVLFWEAQDGDVRRIKEAMNNHGAEVLGSLHGRNYSGLLHVAAKYGHLDIVRLLIEQGAHGADINKADNRGHTPLYYACSRGKLEVARLLIQHQADINKSDGRGQTPFYIACWGGELEIARLLIQHQADINKADNRGQTPLCGACCENELEISRLLIQHHADVNKANDSGMAPLYAACWNGELETARLLIEHQADVHKATDSGETPLYAACHTRLDNLQSRLDIMEELIRHISQHRSIV